MGIVFPLEAEELANLGIAGGDLLRRPPAMVSQIERPAEFDGPLDDLLKVCFCLGNPLVGMLDMEVAHHADGFFLGPGQERFLVGFDEADGAIGDVGAALDKVLPDFGKERQ